MYSRPLGDYRFGYWLLGDEAMGKEITQNIRNICVFAKNILSLQRY
jgi:hypothetical protein